MWYVYDISTIPWIYYNTSMLIANFIVNRGNISVRFLYLYEINKFYISYTLYNCVVYYYIFYYILCDGRVLFLLYIV